MTASWPTPSPWASWSTSRVRTCGGEKTFCVKKPMTVLKLIPTIKRNSTHQEFFGVITLLLFTHYLTMLVYATNLVHKQRKKDAEFGSPKAMASGNYPWQSTKPGRSRVFDWVYCPGPREGTL